MTVLALMFGPLRSDSSLVLPLKPLNEMYALPAKRYIEELAKRGVMIRETVS